MKPQQKILERIATSYPCTTVGMLAGDLHLSERTVRAHIKALEASGKIEAVAPWAPSYSENWHLTDAEIADRRQTAAVKAIAKKAK